MTRPRVRPQTIAKQSRGVEGRVREVRSIHMTQDEFDAICRIASKNSLSFHAVLRVAVRRLIACLPDHS